MSNRKVAIVTGANKGIGYGIVKGLCEKFDGIVYLTARDSKRGEEAVNKLKDDGLKAQFHQLDIEDEESCIRLRDYLQQTYGGLDLLVNNAAVYFHPDSEESFARQAEISIGINYFGTFRLNKYLLPLMRRRGRIVNVSSSCGHLSHIPGIVLKAKLSTPALGYEELNNLMNQFVKSAKTGKHIEAGWGPYVYHVSKVGLCALTRVQQRIADEETPNKNLLINSCHPGYVATDATRHKGILTIEEGARSALFLALENHRLKGKFVWEDCNEWDWLANHLPELNYGK